MSTRTALIVIGTFREDWWTLSPIAQSDFISRVGAIATGAGLEPQAGYRLSATPGAFLEVWEGADRGSVDRAIEELKAMGYTRYIDARWLIGERQVRAAPPKAKPARVAARPTRRRA